MDTQKYEILIVGLGNLIMSDDGVGIHLIRELQKIKVIPIKDIPLLEVGTSPLYYLEEICKAETLIVIDAVKGGKKAGDIYCFKEDDLNINSNPIRNFHDCSILEVIDLARELTKLPAKVIIYGIEPENIEAGEELSLSVQNKMPSLIRFIIKDLKDLLTET